MSPSQPLTQRNPSRHKSRSSPLASRDAQGGWRAPVVAIVLALATLVTPGQAADLASARSLFPLVLTNSSGWQRDHWAPDRCELEQSELEQPEFDRCDLLEPARNWPAGAEPDGGLAGPSRRLPSGRGERARSRPQPQAGDLWAPPDLFSPPGDTLDPNEAEDVVPVAAGPADFLPPQESPSPLWLVPLDTPWWPSDSERGLWSPHAPQPLTGWDEAGLPLGAEAGWLESSETDAAAAEEERLPWGRRVLRRFSGLFDEWTSRIALGGRSLAGNSNQNFVDLLADFENKTPVRATQVNLGGQFGESNNRVVANRWFANSTTDFYHGPRWLTFTKLMDQYDALQNLDYRGTFSAGLGYRFLFDDQRRIIARVGPGVTLEVFHDPADSRVTPDAFGELEVRLPLWQRLKWEQKSTVFPSLKELEIARVQNTTALMYAFDERERWSLRVGFNYQYIGQPNVGKLPSDFTTNVSVMYQRK